MNVSKIKILTAAILSTSLLVGCGGGSDSGNNGGTAPSGKEYSLSGTVQKGPLQPGSAVMISELNDDFTESGVTYTTQIEDYAGNYSLRERFTGKYADLFVEGYYFNEVLGTTDEQLSMSAFVDLEQSTGANFNTATSVMKRSIMAQVKAGTDFNEAVRKATRDLLDIYSYDAVSSDGVNFYEVDLTNAGDTSTILLAISATTLQMATDKDISLEAQIAKIGKVLEVGDVEEVAAMKEELNDYRFSLYAGNTYENTKEYFTKNGLEFTIPHIDYYIDVNGDGKLPNKDLPVFPYVGCPVINLSEVEGTFSLPLQVEVRDEQARSFTYEITQMPTYGTVSEVNLNGSASMLYTVDPSTIQGTITDTIKLDTVAPVKANFEGRLCVTLTNN